MTTFISSTSNVNLYHITDASGYGWNETVKTRCGKSLKNHVTTDWGIGWGHKENQAQFCPKCGNLQDFIAVSDELGQAEQARKQAREQARIEKKKQLEKRLQTHRQLMAEFAEMLVNDGATITNQTEMAAGGDIIFVKDGLKFKLSGSIYND